MDLEYLKERNRDKRTVDRETPLIWSAKHKAVQILYPKWYKVKHWWGIRTSDQRMLPDFMIIGAQKCGTSSLYRVLSKHPSVRPSIKKEIHYFDRHYKDKKIDWYRGHFPLNKYKYDDIGNRCITGEATPSYMLYPYVAQRVKDLVPEVKIIVMLRNPVNRAYSHYFHIYPHLENLPFEHAVAEEQRRLAGEMEKMMRNENYWSVEVARHSYLKRGLYAEQLEVWYSLFRKEQILVIRSEDYYRESETIYGQVLDFLELERFKVQGFKKRIYPSYPPMDPGIRKALSEYFAPHNQRLYELIGRDMGWE